MNLAGVQFRDEGKSIYRTESSKPDRYFRIWGYTEQIGLHIDMFLKQISNPPKIKYHTHAFTAPS